MKLLKKKYRGDTLGHRSVQEFFGISSQKQGKRNKKLTSKMALNAKASLLQTKQAPE